MRAISVVFMAAALAGMALTGEGKDKILRTESERQSTREAKELEAPAGADLATAEVEAMQSFSDTRALANVGCQHCTETVIILDNSSAMFDKELWMFKLLIKEVAAAFLRVNGASRLGLILTTQPNMPLIIPLGPNGQNIQSIWQTVKGIQRVSSGVAGNVASATQTALTLFNFNGTTPVLCAHNLLLLVAPYTALPVQLAESARYMGSYERLRRFAVGTRMTQMVAQVGLETYVGCPGCNHVLYVGNCTPARFLFLVKRLYPIMCVPAGYYREAAIMTFQIDGMQVDDEGLPDFVDTFLDVMAQSTGVERDFLEVIDVRDSGSTAGPQYNARRLKSIESLHDLPQDTLMDIVVRDNPSNLRDTPFRIAGRLDGDLRNELSPVADLFNNEFSAVPKVRNIRQPGESIFSRPTNGLTFQKLYLGSGLGGTRGGRQTLGDLLQA